MEHLFLLAERLVSNVKLELVNNKEAIVFFSFESCTLMNTSFEIRFISANQNVILLSISTHPLDMPWNIKLLIDSNKIDKKYEVYPNLLKETNTLGNELALMIAKDIVNYLKIN